MAVTTLGPATAQGQSTARATETAVSGDVTPKQDSVWAGSSFGWVQSASAQTVGVGQDYQSSNPQYEWTFSLAPRARVWRHERQRLSVRGELGAFREFTNSDTTTQRGEWSLTDAALLGVYEVTLSQKGLYKTVLNASAPVLTLPTSVVSSSNGSILRLGLAVQLQQTVPLLGKDSASLPAMSGGLAVGYTRNFTQATVAVHSDLQRERLGLDGRAVPSDQLSGVPLARDQFALKLQGGTALFEGVRFDSFLGWRLVQRFPVVNAALCGVSQPSCVTPRSVPDPQSSAVISSFGVELGVELTESLGAALGYENVALQLGADGRRRYPFYSPDARFSLVVSVGLDSVYDTALNRTSSSDSDEQGP